jgi:hypothetical protein
MTAATGETGPDGRDAQANAEMRDDLPHDARSVMVAITSNSSGWKSRCLVPSRQAFRSWRHPRQDCVDQVGRALDHPAVAAARAEAEGLGGKGQGCASPGPSQRSRTKPCARMSHVANSKVGSTGNFIPRAAE